MDVRERAAGDLQRIEELIHAESHVKQRDRLRMVLLAWRGWEAEPIAAALSSSGRTVSYHGAATQAVLMSIYRTRRLRGHDPQQAIADALTPSAATKTLPPLPSPAAHG